MNIPMIVYYKRYELTLAPGELYTFQSYRYQYAQSIYCMYTIKFYSLEKKKNSFALIEEFCEACIIFCNIQIDAQII